MTKIADIVAAGPSYSFEFFPPKTPAAERTLEQTLRELEPLQPSFVSVTYGAGGSTREMTHDIVVRINRETSLTAMAHLTCAAHTRDELSTIITRYGGAAVENILALGGDRIVGVRRPVAVAVTALVEGDAVKLVAQCEAAQIPGMRGQGSAMQKQDRAQRFIPPIEVTEPKLVDEHGLCARQYNLVEAEAGANGSRLEMVVVFLGR